MGSKKGNRLRFSKVEDEKLIHEVSIHPAIYDLKHKLYKDQNVRDNIWQSIAKNINDKSGKFFYCFLLTSLVRIYRVSKISNFKHIIQGVRKV